MPGVEEDLHHRGLGGEAGKGFQLHRFGVPIQGAGEEKGHHDEGQEDGEENHRQRVDAESGQATKPMAKVAKDWGFWIIVAMESLISSRVAPALTRMGPAILPEALISPRIL